MIGWLKSLLHIFFTEFDVIEVQAVEIWQLNSITLKLALCLCLGTKLSSFLDLMPYACSS